MSHVKYNQAGYIGCSMSRRAAQAYACGEKPKSKWSKMEMLVAIADVFDNHEMDLPREIELMKKDEIFKKFFICSSYHHTGKFANLTYFYEIDETEVEDYIREKEY